MSVTLSPPPKLQFFDSNGNPLSGGLLYSYAAGTSTPLATYNDASGTTYNTNPVILDSRGEADVWLGAASYKFKLATAANVDIWTVDNIGGGDQFGTVQFLTGVSGSDTITATVTSSSFIAYAAGQMFNFVAAGTNATSSVTLNLNGLGAKTVTKKGTLALAAGDILAGQVITVVYDGTKFQITNAVYLSAPPPIGDVTPNTGAFTTLVAPTVNGDTRFNGNVGMGVAASASYRLNLLAAAGDNGAYISTPELVPAYFVSTDASATGMSVYYYKESATPAASDDMVNLRMFGNNSALALTEYGRIGSDAPSVASGAEDGRMVFRVMANGTLTTGMVLDGSSSIDYGLGIGTTSPNGRVHIVDAVNRTEATAQLSIGGSGYVAAHFLDATAYKIKHSNGSRSIQVIADTNGVSLAPGTTSWAAISDEREKDIIEPISNALMKLADIRTVIGKYKTDPEDTRRSFLIAQDIQAVLPEAVSESDGVLSLRYAEVIPLLLAAVKELTTRVAVLEINAGP
jgi:hypothetical protein